MFNSSKGRIQRTSPTQRQTATCPVSTTCWRQELSGSRRPAFCRHIMRDRTSPPRPTNHDLARTEGRRPATRPSKKKRIDQNFVKTC
ncbi:hypothetical protein L596_026874 [Steinernema carpocapsae]|uniref:Uncharacterized protein n=1 Tax=Steinernema carpocapsae TaxID=34508 RepID=A0A4U5M3L0_STECR|nr:hypothetical protein L596_026874 [Steinernema carpocapsae]